MAKINLLSKNVYQLIAAGEVVERPSSIVKETIENSIDAGAKNITVEIKNGGSTYIRITDDGCGVERSEIKKVFISHATSKISQKDDLDAISTLGFRGEAMASIAAVSKVEMLTKSRDEEFGTRYEISGGEEKAIEDAGCPNGTTIVIRDIFFNTPARMKFLKKDVTEGNAVAGVVDRMAISHPEIAFRFIRDGKQTLVTSGNGELLSAIYSVFGKEVSESLIAVDYTFENMRVFGYVSAPYAARKSRAMQFFFINNRLVKSTTAMAALEQAYKNSIMVGKFPICVLNIEINPSLVDVNVHPAKIEVRFSDERPVFDLVYYGVKTALETDRSVKKADFSLGRGKNFIEADDALRTYSTKIDAFIKKDDSAVQQKFAFADRGSMVLSAPTASRADDNTHSYRINLSQSNDNTDGDTVSEKEINAGEKPAEKAIEEVNIKSTDDENETVDFKLIGEAFKTYLIIEIKNELYFIDKHAAHERMNYEKLKEQSENQSQLLLSPVAVNLAKDEFDAVISHEDLLRQCGFETQVFGESAVIVRAVPSLVTDCDITDLITEIAQKLMEHKTDITPDKIDWIYHCTSCRSAIKAGDNTTPREQELFVQKLLSMPQIRFCPHGRPVFIKISRYDIEKQFGRA